MTESIFKKSVFKDGKIITKNFVLLKNDDESVDLEFKDEYENYTLHFTNNNTFYEYVRSRMKTTDDFYRTSVKDILNKTAYFYGKLYESDKYKSIKTSIDVSNQLNLIYILLTGNRNTSMVIDGDMLYLLVGYRKEITVWYKENQTSIGLGKKYNVKIFKVIAVSEKLKEEFNSIIGEL